MTGLAMKPKQFTGRHMLAITVAFFAVVVGVNLVLAYLANSTWSGLIVKNGYVASQDFNKEQQRARAQEAVGWQAALQRNDDGLHVTFAVRNGTPLSYLEVTGILRRPATENQDLILAFVETAPGLYTASAAPGFGVWDLEISAKDKAGSSFRKTWRFVVKEIAP
jgi:nitrogen fixation protein FixH